MKWHSSPKVRLALIVNGLYFISLFTPPPPYARPRLVAHTNRLRAESPEAKAPPAARLEAKAPPAYATLAPPSGPTQAATHYWKERDQLDVYLTNDLTLIRQLGHTLLLSATFTAKVRAPEPPRSVLLHFVSYSQRQMFDRDTPFVIKADGSELWRSGTNARPLHSAAYHGEQVVETFGVEIPYDLFLQVISARRVVVELGDDRVELTPEQIEALRDMRRRLP